MRTEKDLTLDILKGAGISDLGTHYSLAKSNVTYHKKNLKKATDRGSRSSINYHIRELHRATQLKDSISNLIVYLYRKHSALQQKQVSETSVTAILKKVDLKLTVIDKK